MVISSKQYVGDPISCFCPSHFTGMHVDLVAAHIVADQHFLSCALQGAHVEYTNNICWISNVFYVPLDDTFALNSLQDYTQHNIVDDTQNTQIKVVKVNNLIPFYPFVLLVQAIFFYIPYFLWKNVVSRSAYDISTLVNIAQSSVPMNDQQRRGAAPLFPSNSARTANEETIKYLIRHIDRASGYYSDKFNVSNSKLCFAIRYYPCLKLWRQKKPLNSDDCSIGDAVIG